MKSTTAIVDGVYPLISKSLSSNELKLKKCIGRFIEKRSAQLYDTGPNERIFFGAEDLEDFYSSMAITEKQILNHLRNTYYWSISAFNPRAAKDPFTVANMMVIRYFYKKKKKKELELATIYLAFSGKFYPSIHSGSFPKVVPGENKSVMDYTINNVLTNKFDIKREGSVFGAIRSVCMTWLDSYKDKLENADDEDIVYLVQQLHSRIKSFMKNIATAYYKSYQNKDYLNFESDSLNDDSFRMVDNDSYLAERCTEKTMNFLTGSAVDYKLCTMCADSNIKKDEIKSIMESILDDRDNIPLMREVINIIITDYMRTAKDKDVRSVEFLSYSIKAKPNTKDKNLIKMKQIVTSWLDENSTQYRKRKSRIATANSYYNAILQYIALSINKSNK